MANDRIGPHSLPDDFTWTLVLTDALPVLFFGASTLVISRLFGSTLFLIGALLCLFAGAAKVAWKAIVVGLRKNIWFLFIQMRILMPIGFALMLASLFFDRAKVSFSGILRGISSFPSCLFFPAGLGGMVLMIVFSKILDSTNLRANWIEQLTNAAAQAAILVGLLFLL